MERLAGSGSTRTDDRPRRHARHPARRALDPPNHARHPAPHPDPGCRDRRRHLRWGLLRLLHVHHEQPRPTARPAGPGGLQEINRGAPNPLFMLALFGTALVCLVLGVSAVRRLGDPVALGSSLAVRSTWWRSCSRSSTTSPATTCSTRSTRRARCRRRVARVSDRLDRLEPRPHADLRRRQPGAHGRRTTGLSDGSRSTK